MPSRFIDLGSVDTDTRKIATEIANEAVDAIEEGLRVVQAWAWNVSVIENQTIVYDALSVMNNTATALNRRFLQMPGRDRRTILECVVLVSVACLFMCVRCLVLGMRSRSVVYTHLKFE